MMFYLIFAFALRMQRANALTSIVLIFCGLIFAGSVVPEWMAAVRFWGDPIILEFLVGILIASWYLNGVRLPVAVRLAMIGTGILSAIALHHAAIALEYRVLTHGVPAFLVTAAAVLGNEPSRVGYAGRLLRLGGDASYALYLSHPFSINVFALGWKRIVIDAPWAFVTGATAFSIIVAVCVFYLIERPILLSLNAWAARKSSTVVSAGP
jgi:peptidoglycan/LPS O-acetylase OafA/YrhL